MEPRVWKIRAEKNEKDMGNCPVCGKKWKILDVPEIGLNRTVETEFGGDFPCPLCEAYMGIDSSECNVEGVLG